MIRTLLAFLLACAGLATSLAASRVTAGNQELAGELHDLALDCQLRSAAIEHLCIRVRGRVGGDPLGEPLEQRVPTNDVQSGGTVSGSSSLGGSRAADSGVFHGVDGGLQ